MPLIPQRSWRVLYSRYWDLPCSGKGGAIGCPMFQQRLFQILLQLITVFKNAFTPEDVPRFKNSVAPRRTDPCPQGITFALCGFALVWPSSPTQPLLSATGLVPMTPAGLCGPPQLWLWQPSVLLWPSSDGDGHLALDKKGRVVSCRPDTASAACLVYQRSASSSVGLGSRAGPVLSSSSSCLLFVPLFESDFLSIPWSGRVPTTASSRRHRPRFSFVR